MVSGQPSDVVDFQEEWERFCGLDEPKSPSLQFGIGAPEQAAPFVGDVTGKRVLVIGADPWNNSVILAKRGANVILVDPSAVALERTRQLAEKETLRIDAHLADFAELAFTMADTVDLAISGWAMAFTTDLGRMFRQVHRVLKPTCSFVFGVPHPAAALFETSATTEAFSQHLPAAVRRSWFDSAPVRYGAGSSAVRFNRITFSDLYPEAVRAGLHLDACAEPEPTPNVHQPSLLGTDRPLVPASAIYRLRKLGS